MTGTFLVAYYDLPDVCGSRDKPMKDRKVLWLWHNGDDAMYRKP